MHMIIPVPKQYDMLSSVHAWIFPDIQPVPEMTWNNHYSRVITSNKQHEIPVKIEQVKPGENLCIHLPNNSITNDEISRKIHFILGLTVDTNHALSVIQNDSVLSNLKSSLEGIKPYLTDTLFEALLKSIIQQQISYRVANMLTQRLILNVKNPVIFDEVKVYRFPTPKLILEVGVDKLRTFGFGKKSDYITNISSLLVSGNLNLDSLRNSSYEEISEVLKPIKGIGEWTVDAFCIAGIGNFEVFPYGDIGVRNLLGRLYGSGGSISKRKVIEKSESWGHCGPMVLYLLMCAEVLGLINKLPSENA